MHMRKRTTTLATNAFVSGTENAMHPESFTQINQVSHNIFIVGCLKKRANKRKKEKQTDKDWETRERQRQTDRHRA